MQQKHIISCDWGTSSLRLQLIEAASQKRLAKVGSSHGNAVIFKGWKTQVNADRVEFYLRYLQPLLNELSATAGIPVDGISIVVSGMASSSVGLKELRYADVPFNLDGTSAYCEWIRTNGVIDNPILLISGVQQHDDVMRGEETQVSGIVSLFDLPKDDVLFVLPGTHSKHIFVKNNCIVSFRTFMTGEIFEILTKHSILSHAVDTSFTQHISKKDEHFFQQGVEKALQGELLNSLFSVRINQLKNYLTPQQNYYYLSGLLIGTELKHVVNDNRKLVLCSSGSLLKLYAIAIESAGLSERTIVVPEEILDNAAAAGQIKILNNAKTV